MCEEILLISVSGKESSLEYFGCMVGNLCADLLPVYRFVFHVSHHIAPQSDMKFHEMFSMEVKEEPQSS